MEFFKSYHDIMIYHYVIIIIIYCCILSQGVSLWARTLAGALLTEALPAGLWSLDNLEDPETKRILSEVQSNPERFVLKPQREGGGNNLYGRAILDRLKDRQGLAAFILMQRIRPPIHRYASFFLHATHLLKRSDESWPQGWGR